jgi:hypothetical protein
MRKTEETMLPDLIDLENEIPGTTHISNTKGYYESLGMCRYTLILGKAHKTALNKLARQFRITQGSVIEAFLDNIDLERMTPIFQAKETKGGGRKSNQSVTQRSLIEMLKGMTAEQLATAQESILAAKNKISYASNE